MDTHVTDAAPPPSPDGRAPDTDAASRDAGRALRRWSMAALLANIGIVVTGGIVRVTASGLGCPTWPTCEAGSVLPSAGGEHGWRQLVEFGNRTLTGVVLLAVVGAWVAARRATPPGDPRRLLAGTLVAGVATQAVVGGITVRLDLHPLTVSTHFLLSMVLIGLATVLVVLARRPGPPRAEEVALRPYGRALLAAGGAVLVLGTLVTATGPHAGDPGTPRLDLPLVWMARTHSTAVWITVGLTVLVLLRARRVDAASARWAGMLLGVEVAQGAVGYWQYLTAVPPTLVIVHMALACAFWVLCVRIAVATGALGPRVREPGSRLPSSATVHA